MKSSATSLIRWATRCVPSTVVSCRFRQILLLCWSVLKVGRRDVGGGYISCFVDTSVIAIVVNFPYWHKEVDPNAGSFDGKAVKNRNGLYSKTTHLPCTGSCAIVCTKSGQSASAQSLIKKQIRPENTHKRINKCVRNVLYSSMYKITFFFALRSEPSHGVCQPGKSIWYDGVLWWSLNVKGVPRYMLCYV